MIGFACTTCGVDTGVVPDTSKLNARTAEALAVNWKCDYCLSLAEAEMALVFNWQPTGRANGLALPPDAFADVWAVTYREGQGWVIIKNREQLPWLFFNTCQKAKETVEASIKGLADA